MGGKARIYRNAWIGAVEKEMGTLEKVLITITVILAVAAVVLLAVPDSAGRSGLAAVSPLLDRANYYVSQATASIDGWLTEMSNSLRPPGQKVSAPSAGGGSQPNPFESAVGPAAGYGQAQKDVYKKPLEGLNR